ncbi:LLM class flavin-dependent oxidoreductase [Erythrobacteraceae bacterium E2-1 Yellow Sea]|nr:LLM class flavin-dependent oxidoreductase [Erythrobacteraceae bacterium E2-1 Yellow Sea]
MTNPTLSILDLVPILEGGSISQALANAADLASLAESLGYSRYWVAEHHGMPGIGGAATSVVLAHIGAHTKSIRIGSGGIMLPNHTPLQIAEQFGTLDALYPGRVDLGMGRAPGSDRLVSRALHNGDATTFPQQILELQAYFAGDPRMGFTAVPGAGAAPEIWILGSSLYGAQLAAALGLPYAFASHFAPAMLDEAIETYRRQFKPSAILDKPHVMVACSVFAADRAEEAKLIATTQQQLFVNIRTGQPRGRVPAPQEGYYESLPDQTRYLLDDMMSCSAIGSREDVSIFMEALISRTKADEIIIGGQIYDNAARLRSFAIAAEALEAATMVAEA